MLTVSSFEQNINTEVFNSWVDKDLIPKLPKGSIVIMDNTAFHKNQNMKNQIKAAGHVLEYLPPYSGLDIQLCKFIHKPLNITLNSIVKFYQKVSHSFIPISNRHSPFCRDVVNCQV